MKTIYEIKKGELVFKIIKMDNLDIKLDVSYDGSQANAGFYVDLSTDEYLNMIKEIIPGSVDDILIDAIKSGIK